MRGIIRASLTNNIEIHGRDSQLFQAIDIVHPETQQTTTSLILGHVKAIHVRKDVLNERGVVDPFKLKPIGRGADITYFRTGDAFRLGRPDWATEGQPVYEGLQKLQDGNA